MAITLSASDVPGPPLSARLTPPQVWGIVLLAPYFLVFAAFVVYPVCYGLWLARQPASYVALFHDPGALFSRGGLVWYGGFIGGALAVILNGWRLKVPTR